MSHSDRSSYHTNDEQAPKEDWEVTIHDIDPDGCIKKEPDADVSNDLASDATPSAYDSCCDSY